MTDTKTKSSFFSSEKLVNFKHSFRLWASKLSASFLIVIAALPIAGLFLGIGSSMSNIAAKYNGESVWIFFGNILSNIGMSTFTFLPLFFCISVALAFTRQRAESAIIACVGFMVFIFIISFLLIPLPNGDYSFLFFTAKSTQVGDFFGVKTLQSGIIGGITIGAFVAFVYNRFHNIILPEVIGFFSGIRFLPIFVLIFSIPVSIIFAAIWIYVGGLFSTISSVLGNLDKTVTIGLSSFIFQIIHRSIVPFGIHHAVYLPLWQTPLGGNVYDTFVDYLNKHGATLGDKPSYKEIFDYVNNNDVQINGHKIAFKSYEDFEKIISSVGDQLVSIAIFNNGGWADKAHTGGFFVQDIRKMGLRVGRFGTSGWFPYMIFGLPAAALAMIRTVPKAKRKKAWGLYGSAALTSILTGITEPIEFTFLLVSPVLYYVFYVPICGISGLFSNLLPTGFYISVPSFFGGLIELIAFGILPTFSGQATNWWIVIIVGIPIGILMYSIFFVYIVKNNVPIPGREGLEKTDFRLFSAKDWRDKFFGKL